jgi:hypothetical protein
MHRVCLGEQQLERGPTRRDEPFGRERHAAEVSTPTLRDGHSMSLTGRRR